MRSHAELPKVWEAARSDHWLVAVQLLEWQLYLVRNEVSQQVLPWQTPQTPGEIIPNRVMQSLPSHLSQVGMPVSAVQPSGKRQTGP
jgi:hypothetical protein